MPANRIWATQKVARRRVNRARHRPVGLAKPLDIKMESIPFVPMVPVFRTNPEDQRPFTTAQHDALNGIVLGPFFRAFEGGNRDVGTVLNAYLEACGCPRKAEKFLSSLLAEVPKHPDLHPEIMLVALDACGHPTRLAAGLRLATAIFRADPIYATFDAVRQILRTEARISSLISDELQRDARDAYRDAMTCIEKYSPDNLKKANNGTHCPIRPDATSKPLALPSSAPMVKLACFAGAMGFALACLSSPFLGRMRMHSSGPTLAEQFQAFKEGEVDVKCPPGAAGVTPAFLENFVGPRTQLDATVVEGGRGRRSTSLAEVLAQCQFAPVPWSTH
jgi:hypothetical protein